MADWVNIPDTALDPDAPLTSELAYAWRNNPIAMAEGRFQAPRILPQAMGNFVLGRGGFSRSGGVNNNLIVALPDTFRQVTCYIAGQNSATTTVNRTVSIRLSSNSGSSWSAYYNVFSSNDANASFARIAIIDSVAGIIEYADSPTYSPISISSAGFNRIEFSVNGGSAAADITGRATVIGLGGAF